MKTKRMLFLFSLFAVSSFGAGKPTGEPSVPARESGLDSQATQPVIISGKSYQVNSPLTLPFKSERPSERPATPIQDRRAQAWTSIVGWRPGASAFPDPMTHESELTVFSISHKPH